MSLYSEEQETQRWQSLEETKSNLPAPEPNPVVRGGAAKGNRAAKKTTETADPTSSLNQAASTS